jgi:hypothetical protein
VAEEDQDLIDGLILTVSDRRPRFSAAGVAGADSGRLTR